MANTLTNTTIPTLFRGRMRMARLLRWCLSLALVTGFASLYILEGPYHRWAVAVSLIMVALWFILAIQSIQVVRAARTGSLLLAEGKHQEATQHLVETLKRVSPLRADKILACHYLAVAAHLRQEYREAIAICRELLAHRFGPLRSLVNGTKLILADSLLMVSDADSAGQIVRAMKHQGLSLNDQLTLLPIELRYYLIADRGAEIVEALQEKVRLAELLDSTASATVHALLAEGCRRMDMEPEHSYLLKRAHLLADLDPIIAKLNPLLKNVRSDQHGGAPDDAGDKEW